MRSLLRLVPVFCLPFLLLLHVEVSAQGKKDKDKDKDLANSNKMIAAGVVRGRVAAVYEEKKRIRLAVQVPQLNPGAVNEIQQGQINLVQARMRNDVQGVINAQRQIAQGQSNLYTMHWQDIELDIQDDVVVRMLMPRPSFDDKGRIRKLTRAELKELKGPDPKLPGYKAEFSDVQTEQIIEVSLVRKKSAPLPRPRKGKKDVDPENPDLLGDHLPQVKQIVIIHEPMGS